MMNIIEKIIRKFYRKFHYYQTEFKRDYLESEYVEKIEEATVEDIKRQYPEEFTDRKYDIFKDRYSSENDHGYVLKIDGQITSYAWIGINQLYEGSSGYSTELAEDTAYLFDLYTFEKFRKKGLMEKLVETLFHIYKNKGYKYMTTIVSFENMKSNKLMSKFDFKVIGLISTKYFKGDKYFKYKNIRQ